MNWEGSTITFKRGPFISVTQVFVRTKTGVARFNDPLGKLDEFGLDA